MKENAESRICFRSWILGAALTVLQVGYWPAASAQGIPVGEGDVELWGLLPAQELTDERLAKARDDRDRLAVAMIQMLQAQLFESDARLELSDARGELQVAAASLLSLDGPRGKIVVAMGKLSELAPESARLVASYNELLRELREEYQAEACQPTLEVGWRCRGASPGQAVPPAAHDGEPAQAGGDGPAPARRGRKGRASSEQ